KAYQNEEVLQSTLVEGSIELEFGGNKKRLKPNEQAVIRSGSPAIEVRSIDVYNEIAWRDGVFGFENEALEEIMKVLSRWYDVEVVCETQSIKDLRFTGALRKKLEIEKILDIISRSNDIEYKIENQTIVLQ